MLMLHGCRVSSMTTSRESLVRTLWWKGSLSHPRVVTALRIRFGTVWVSTGFTHFMTYPSFLLPQFLLACCILLTMFAKGWWSSSNGQNNKAAKWQAKEVKAWTGHVIDRRAWLTHFCNRQSSYGGIATQVRCRTFAHSTVVFVCTQIDRSMDVANARCLQLQATGNVGDFVVVVFLPIAT